MTETDRQSFGRKMFETAVATRSTINDADCAVYWDKFRKWDLAEFTEAMDRCEQELTKFPTVSQVRGFRPKKRETIESIDPIGRRAYQPLVGVNESPVDRGPADLESQIDNMSDAELAEVFIDACEYRRSNWLSEEQIENAGKFLVGRFRANPNGAIYRGFVREAVQRLGQN